MRDIREIYDELKDLNLVLSQNEFSTDFLGKSPRYYSYLLATNRQPSIGASYALSVRLEMIADHLRANGNIKWAERFADLANVVEDNARYMALNLTPCSREKGNFSGRR